MKARNLLGTRAARIAIATALTVLIPATLVADDTRALRIEVVDGQDVVHDVRRNLPKPTVIEVRDGEDRTVAGAQVTFALPARGPGGTFVDGGSRAIAYTDRSGRAKLTGFIPNRLEGDFDIAVSVKAPDHVPAAATVHQANALPEDEEPVVKRHGGGSRLLIVLAVGAAAAAVGIMATKHGTPAASGSLSTAGSSQNTAVSIGVISIGAPK